MSKLSVNVNVPAVGQKYEFMIPSAMAVKDIIILITKILASEYGVSDDTTESLLMDKKDCKVLKMDCYLTQLGISSGDELILI